MFHFIQEVTMSRLPTLDEMDHLEQCRFGRPSPRHGLKLLYWFANDGLSFDLDDEMFSKCDPDKGEFGFHLFQNRYERNGVKLLPNVDLPYYVLGNLNKPRSYELPRYVREEHTRHHDNSNMDRIIVSMDNEWFEKVYVTEHKDRSTYNADATYNVSKNLLKIIRGLSLIDYLWRTGFWWKPEIIRSLNINIPQPKSPVNQMTVTLVPDVGSQRNQVTCLEPLNEPESKQENNPRNNQENNQENIQGNIQENIQENNQENIQENNQENNPGNNQENIQENNQENNPGNNQENIQEHIRENNQENNPGNNPGNNQENKSQNESPNISGNECSGLKVSGSGNRSTRKNCCECTIL